MQPSKGCITKLLKSLYPNGHSFAMHSDVHRVLTPPPPRPLSVAKAIIICTCKLPPPPHWDRGAIEPNHNKFMSTSALAPM